MAEVNRICPACGKNTPLEAQHCPHCGTDTRAGVPMRQENALATTVSRAALPVLATAGTLALRMLWKLLRNRLLTVAITPITPTVPAQASAQTPQKAATEVPTRRSGRSIRIRTAWAVGDASGIKRQGYTDQQIDFDE